MKTKHFIPAATLAFAITFTLSCSGSDDPDNGGGDVPSGGITNGTGSFSGSGAGEKAQAYVVTNDGQLQKYTGNGDITISHDINVGKIESGIVKLQFPSSVASTYLGSISDAFGIEEVPSNCNIPSNVKIRPVADFYIEPPQSGYGEDYLSFVYHNDGNDDQAEIVSYIYSSGAANVKCDLEESYHTYSININLAQGWNEAYITESSSEVSGKLKINRKYSTDKNILKHLNDMKWVLSSDN